MRAAQTGFGLSPGNPEILSDLVTAKSWTLWPSCRTHAHGMTARQLLENIPYYAVDTALLPDSRQLPTMRLPHHAVLGELRQENTSDGRIVQAEQISGGMSVVLWQRRYPSCWVMWPRALMDGSRTRLVWPKKNFKPTKEQVDLVLSAADVAYAAALLLAHFAGR